MLKYNTEKRMKLIKALEALANLPVHSRQAQSIIASNIQLNSLYLANNKAALRSLIGNNRNLFANEVRVSHLSALTD